MGDVQVWQHICNCTIKKIKAMDAEVCKAWSDHKQNGGTGANNFYMILWLDIIGKWPGSGYGRTFFPVS